MLPPTSVYCFLSAQEMLFQCEHTSSWRRSFRVSDFNLYNKWFYEMMFKNYLVTKVASYGLQCSGDGTFEKTYDSISFFKTLSINVRENCKIHLIFLNLKLWSL